MARLETLYSLERLEKGVLDKVVGVGHVTGPAGQPASRKPLQRSEVPCEESLDSGVIALPRPGEKVRGRFDWSGRQRRIGRSEGLGVVHGSGFFILVRFPQGATLSDQNRSSESGTS